MQICIHLPKDNNRKTHFYLSFNTFINLVKPTFPSQILFFVNKQISYFFPLRGFLNLMNLKLINLMSMNFKLINLTLMNFVNKQISHFFSLRCFLSLINFMLMNFKLINLMSMNFKVINLMLVNFKLINLMSMNDKS